MRPVSVIIPALNEEESIPLVLGDIPKDWVSEVIVVDNGSSDRTAQVAADHGARVAHEPRRGYGSACLKGLSEMGSAEVVLFLDADYSDYPDEAPSLLQPILDDEADLVIGSRILGEREPGALLPQAYFGNKLATFLMRLLAGARYTDLGPFRAIRLSSLTTLEMCDTNFGWTAEMQIKAARAGLRTMEVPVKYRRRKGVSKITGTVKGTISAGWKIIYTIARYAWWRPSKGGTVDRPAEPGGEERPAGSSF